MRFGAREAEFMGVLRRFEAQKAWKMPDTLGGYVSDPMLAACNLQAAAEATGRADFAFSREVTEILTANGRVAGAAVAITPYFL